MVPILTPRVVWECPNCQERMATDGTPDKPILHPCAGLKGFLAPMVPEGADCKVEAVERGDYLNGEDVRLDGEGRPIMAVVTTRADGSNDCVAFAASAHATGEAT